MKQGFTLIELLAVIVVLAIIAVIATPIIINIIDDAKESSTLRSSELYMSAVELAIAKASSNNIDITTCTVDDNNLKCGEEEYEIKIDGEIPEEVEIKTTKEGEINAVIKTNGYCIIKREEDVSFSYKKIVDRVNDDEKEITKNMCALNPYTSENCFAFDSSTGTITKYYNNENNNNTNPACPKNVVIPKKISGVEVKIVGSSSFQQKKITGVTIPEGVVTIGNSAFWGNNITNLELPNSITSIEASAFRSNSIETLKLPEGYFTLGSCVFYGSKLPPEEAFIYKRNSDGSIDYTTIMAYAGAEKENVIIPSEKNGVKLTTIGASAFQTHNIKGVTIPEGVVTIGNSAFWGNNITNLELPNSVTAIEGWAFYNNPIETLKLPEGYFTIGSMAFYGSKLKPEDAFIYKRNKDGSIDYTTIMKYVGEEKDNVIIPSEKNGVKLTTIGSVSFNGIGIKGITIPEGITTIKGYAFQNNNITNLELPNSVTTIEGWAFYSNPLTSVTIKNKKENVSIGGSAFGAFSVNNIVWDYVDE